MKVEVVISCSPAVFTSILLITPWKLARLFQREGCLPTLHWITLHWRISGVCACVSICVYVCVCESALPLSVAVMSVCASLAAGLVFMSLFWQWQQICSGVELEDIPQTGVCRCSHYYFCCILAPTPLTNLYLVQETSSVFFNSHVFPPLRAGTISRLSIRLTENSSAPILISN